MDTPEIKMPEIDGYGADIVNFQDIDEWALKYDGEWREADAVAHKIGANEVQRLRIICACLLSARTRVWRRFRMGKSQYVVHWDGTQMWDSEGPIGMSLHHAEEHLIEILE